jgi:hypothetical protein
MPVPSRHVTTLSSKSRGRPARRKPKTITWPHNFYVCDISTGMADLDKLCAEGVGCEKAFRASFPNAKCSRTTHWKYRRQWNEMDADIKELFVNYGEIPKGLFPQLLKAIENPHLLEDTSPSPSRSVTCSRSCTPSRSFIHSRSRSPASVHSWSPSSIHSRSPSSVHCSGSSYSSSQFPAHPFFLPSKQLGPLHPPSLVDRSIASSSILAEPGPAMAHASITSVSTSSLCKFCDQPMPSIQSAQLIVMWKHLECVTWPEKSLENVNHHEARSFTVYVMYCEQHRFEQELLPEVEQEGWPKDINFDKPHSHILSHQEVIELIMIELAESEFFELAKKARLLKQKGKNTNTLGDFTEQSAG